MQIKIYDTTLRDGAQSSDVNFSVQDKLEIAKALDDYGVDYIELGWPYASADEMECFKQAREINFKHAKIAAFGSTRRISNTVEEDLNLNAIIKCGASVGTIFGKTWLLHVEKQLKATPEQNLDAIKSSIKFLKDNNLEVVYDAEHFYDGFKDNSEYALKTLKVAADGGADCLVLCDTKGGCLPEEIIDITKQVKEYLEQQNITVELGIHAHNDSGLAVANSIISVNQGVTHIQGTINGLGERTGNADLCQVVPNIIIKQNHSSNIILNKTKSISEFIYTFAGIKTPNNQPFVGMNSFRHKGGIHVDAIEKIGQIAYEHIDPTSVGNKSEVMLSDLAGKANILRVARNLNFKIDPKDPKVLDVRKKAEEMYNQGFDMDLKSEQFLLLHDSFDCKKKVFKIKTWQIMTQDLGEEFSECILTGEVEGEQKKAVSQLLKRGPVDGIYHAMQELLLSNFPSINDIELINFKVRMAKEMAEKSPVNVFIEFKNNEEVWANEGISTNIIEASLQAIEKGFRYHLIKNSTQQ